MVKKSSILRLVSLLFFLFILLLLILLSSSTYLHQVPKTSRNGPRADDQRLLRLASDLTPIPLLSDDLLLDDDDDRHHRRHYHHHRRRYPNAFIGSEARKLLHSWSRLIRLRHPPVSSPGSILPPLLPAPPTSCAVVGNSGILLSSSHGSTIDAHEYVIRLNNARIAGFNHDVGSRTNLSFINSNVLHQCARRGLCTCHSYGDNVPTLMYICQSSHFVDLAICSHNTKGTVLVTDPRFDTLCMRIVKYYSIKRFVEETGQAPEEWELERDERAFHYSSGMQAVMLAVGVCGNVSLFGFGKTSHSKHHYHTNQKVELDLHDYEAEYQFYRDLAEQRLAVPFLKEAGFKVPPLKIYR